MPDKFNGVMSRRRFLQLSGAATAAAALGGPRILHALVPSTETGPVDQVQELFSAFRAKELNLISLPVKGTPV